MVQLLDDSAGPSHGGPSVSLGALLEDQMSIPALGDGLSSSEDNVWQGCLPRVLSKSDPELTAMHEH